jgi:hypothetical protein
VKSCLPHREFSVIAERFHPTFSQDRQSNIQSTRLCKTVSLIIALLLLLLLFEW